ncbi:MAG: DUF2442 domain-containing protein [Arcicella sp.]|jgi:hypothetical protein|nr:DUF2442 domain-containing protein [Arcicella sp.]
MLPRITKVLEVEPYKIKCLWSTGEYKTVDFSDFLKDYQDKPSFVFHKLLDKSVFKTVRLDEVGKTLCWDNLTTMKDYDGSIKPAPIDFCPDVLYSWAT